MFVYRAKGVGQSDLNARLDAARGVESFVSEIKSKVSDPVNNPAFSYNFTMNPYFNTSVGPDQHAYTCVETVLESFNRGGLTGEKNPYAPSLWSRFDPAHGEIFSKFLNMTAPRFPSPGDLDLNPNYELASLRLDVSKLGQDRAEMASIDALFTLIAMKKSDIRNSLSVFDDLGSSPVTEAQLTYLRSLSFIPAESRKMIDTSVPANMNLKQLVFFGYLNNVFTPKMRTAVLADAEVFTKAMRRPPGLGELRAMAAKNALIHLEDLKKMTEEFKNKGA